MDVGQSGVTAVSSDTRHTREHLSEYCHNQQQQQQQQQQLVSIILFINNVNSEKIFLGRIVQIFLRKEGSSRVRLRVWCAAG